MFESINAYVQKCASLTEQELARFNNLLSYKKLRKKSFLLRAGEVCKEEAFVLKGCLKSYLINEQGQEVILTFAVENWWVSDLSSFQDQKPSQMFIESIEDSELLVLTTATKAALLDEIPKFEKVFRLMVQRHLASYQERLFGNIATPAPERYLQFLQKYPSISQRVPQHLIASYLGISPEFLSKIRSKLGKS